MGRDTRSAAAVDGAAARALGEQARERWQTATGQSLEPVDAKHAAWPSKLEPALRNVDVGIARTLPELDDRGEVREVEALNLAAIAAARHTIYLENQYLAARRIVDALAARLGENDGPEIVIVLPRQRQQPPRAGNDGRRTPPAHSGAVGSRRSSPAGRLLAGDRRRHADLRPLQGAGGRRSATARRLVELSTTGRWGSTASAMSPSRRTATTRTTTTSAVKSRPCEINWCRNTWVCPSASSRARCSMRLVPEGRRGASRRGQDVAAVHRARRWPARRARWRRTT